MPRAASTDRGDAWRRCFEIEVVHRLERRDALAELGVGALEPVSPDRRGEDRCRSRSARSAACRWFCIPLALSPPRRTPRALAAARASLMRRLISARSFLYWPTVLSRKRYMIALERGYDATAVAKLVAAASGSPGLVRSPACSIPDDAVSLGRDRRDGAWIRPAPRACKG
jgi:hypothetical protein